MPNRKLIRLGIWLQRCWRQSCLSFPEMEYEWRQFRGRWEAVQLAYRRCCLAATRGLSLCLPELQRQLEQALRYLAELNSVLSSTYQPINPPELTLRHWLEEVTQLHDEFDSVTFVKNEGKIRVETSPITLRDIYLGPFAIDLRLKGETISILNFEIVALDPQASSHDSEVTHPHVKEGELCAGDAKVPIRAALEAGRLVDAFLLIQSTLQTYNRQSAYVTLDKWFGVTCSDCSETVDPEYSYTCEGCRCTMCSQCISSCSSCSTSYCPSCIGGCADCKADCCSGCLEESESNQSSYCRQCRARCNKCGNLAGKEELDAENQYCPECKEDDLEPEPSEATQEAVLHE